MTKNHIFFRNTKKIHNLLPISIKNSIFVICKFSFYEICIILVINKIENKSCGNMENKCTEEEFKLILSRYSDIQKKLRGKATREQKANVKKAFRLALSAHENMRRRSGEPYILHPLEVANIILDNMNLGSTSVICALLHDTVEDTEYTLQDIEGLFGEEIAAIIDGLTKIDDISDTQASQQFETFKKILLSMSKDPRVILIKLADRLHNMRTLDAMPADKQMKIASETVYMYAPLAHRLGFYNIKSELEDLAMKYQDPGSYNYILERIKATENERDIFIKDFIQPIENRLIEAGFKYEILARTKSISSIWQKMIKKKIPFEEVFDLFAIRIIIEADDDLQKSACWSVYSLVTDVYKPNNDRLRDWISTPKSNGYQSLHTTVMSHTGKWVEVQIRTRQMDAIAENGFASHWIYKEDGKQNYEQGVESWLASVKDILQHSEGNTGELISNMKMNLYEKEIYVFTSKGEERVLPRESTVLDFAYELSEQLGNCCIGAKVNTKLMPPSTKLKNGDQIEIITSQKQVVQENWLTFVATAKATDCITKVLEQRREDQINEGKQMLRDYMAKNNIDVTKPNRDKLMLYTGVKEKKELYLDVYKNKITEITVKQCFSKMGFFYKIKNLIKPVFTKLKGFKNIFTVDHALRRRVDNNPKELLLGENVSEIKQTIATCCNPVAGDPIIAFSIDDKEIVVHRANCKEAISMSARYGNRIVKAKWRPDTQNVEFLAGISIRGFDSKGLVNSITSIIYQDFNVNCRSIRFDSSEGMFEGTIILYIQNVDHLNKLMDRLKVISGIEKVSRI